MNIGACWLKETKDGKKYFSGQIQVPGLSLNFAIFKNEKKDKDNQPDYNIVWSPPRKDNGASQGTAQTDEQSPFSDEDIPF